MEAGEQEYILRVNGEELDQGLRQLDALSSSAQGKVLLAIVDGELEIKRKVGSKSSASFSIRASGYWPFPLQIRWDKFRTLILKKHAPLIQILMRVSPSGKGKLNVDGMQISAELVSRQLSLDLLSDWPAWAKKASRATDLQAMAARIAEIDAINAKNGILSKREIAISYERDKELSSLIKKVRGEKCQVCSYSFQMKNGSRYVECHHLEHLSNQGLDCSSNILVLCPNHHMQFHHGLVEIQYHDADKLIVEIDGIAYTCDLSSAVDSNKRVN